jgi:hypothetical protein
LHPSAKTQNIAQQNSYSLVALKTIKTFRRILIVARKGVIGNPRSDMTSRASGSPGIRLANFGFLSIC